MNFINGLLTKDPKRRYGFEEIKGDAFFAGISFDDVLAKKIVGTETVHFGAIDIEVKRNAYGRQLGSFYTEAQFKGIGIIPMVFIRAPYIETVSPDIEILSEVDGRIVAARGKNILVSSYHPELTDDNRVHRYFIENVVLPATAR